MGIITDFIKDNTILVVTIAGCILFAIIFALVWHFRKRPERREKRDSKKFNDSIERFERTHYKKCLKCGGNVPIEDNICMNCGEIPN